MLKGSLVIQKKNQNNCQIMIKEGEVVNQYYRSITCYEGATVLSVYVHLTL